MDAIRCQAAPPWPPGIASFSSYDVRDADRPTGGGLVTGQEPLRCSAKGCARRAEFALRWNNRKIHPAERRKTWLACPDHRQSLTEFLSIRGMFRECEAI